MHFVGHEVCHPVVFFLYEITNVDCLYSSNTTIFIKCFLHKVKLRGHYQAPKHVVVPYVENTLYSTNRYSWVIRVHTMYFSHLVGVCSILVIKSWTN